VVELASASSSYTISLKPDLWSSCSTCVYVWLLVGGLLALRPAGQLKMYRLSVNEGLVVP
jgi:hypothetical protein